MNLDELEAQCRRNLDSPHAVLKEITLVFPRGAKRPPGFPRSTELLCVNSRGERAYSFEAARVLRWIGRAREALELL